MKNALLEYISHLGFAIALFKKLPSRRSIGGAEVDDSGPATGNGGPLKHPIFTLGLTLG